MNSKRKKSTPVVEKCQNGEVEIKASLSRTRKIIAQKFRKLHMKRLSDERKRERKLAPVTDSLKKIISQRDEINRNRNRNRRPNVQNEMDRIEEMEIDDNDFNNFGQPPRYEAVPPPPYEPPPPPIPPRPRSFHEILPRVPPRRSSPALAPSPPIPRLPSTIHREPRVADNEQLHNDQMRSFFDDIIQNNSNNSRLNRKRSSIPTADVDIFDANNRKLDSKIRRQELEQLDVDDEEHNSDEGAVGGQPNIQNSRKVVEIMTEEDKDMNSDYFYDNSTNNIDVSRRKRLLTRHALQRKHDKARNLAVVSPDDYDDFGLYRGPGVKRSKMEMDERFIKKAMTRLKSQKLIQQLRHETHGLTDHELEQNFDRYTEYLKTASPEDFDDDGQFIGSLDRRRLLSLLVSRINSSSEFSRVRKRELKKGKGIEKSFIPYNQNIVYEYYDNPNELCDRLRLLLASKGAGNTNHDQEVNSIVEELRERGIIF